MKPLYISQVTALTIVTIIWFSAGSKCSQEGPEFFFDDPGPFQTVNTVRQNNILPNGTWPFSFPFPGRLGGIVLNPAPATFPGNFTVLSPTSEQLKQHKTVLEAAGISDLSALGDMTLSGLVMPQIGITVPSADQYEAQGALFQHACQVDASRTSLVRFGGIARRLKAKPPPSTGLFSLLPDNLHAGPPRPTVRASAPSTGGMVVDSYIVARTLRLEDNLLIILDYPNLYLTIIAEEVIVGQNVTITWERPMQHTSRKLDPPGKPPKADPPFWEDGTTPGLWGVTGQRGIDGIKGFEDDPRRSSKGYLDGADAPEIELWTLSLKGRPVVDVGGQDGGQGGPGQDGGDGGDGSTGWDAVPEFLIDCRRSHGAGGNGGDGGKGGDGGTGGDGGHGGRFKFYAPQSVLTEFARGFLTKADGGGRGEGGVTGLAGNGGEGHKCLRANMAYRSEQPRIAVA
ncbi:hypothetical protein V502_01018 [Pseudogymnoascus sp. VKM F-4520 (FW-2644)]|nr:hypothetical protein V502_01018 [Pseudogymnoascus sp. VKM F-4520 (FW-2644)]